MSESLYVLKKINPSHSLGGIIYYDLNIPFHIYVSNLELSHLFTLVGSQVQITFKTAALRHLRRTLRDMCVAASPQNGPEQSLPWPSRV